MTNRWAVAAAFFLGVHLVPPHALAMAPVDSVELEEVQTVIKAGDYQQAVEALVTYIQANPDDPDGYSLLGFSFRKLGQFERSKQAYDRALELDPDHKGANEYLGELYLQTDRLELAKAQLEKLRRICGGDDCEEYRELAASIAQATR